MPDRPLRFVTLNTWKNEGDYAARLRAMGAGLRALHPDIVLLQEVFRTPDGAADTGRALADALGLALSYAPGRAKPRAWGGREVPSEAGLAVLARGTIVHHESMPLPSDERGGERIALFAEVACEGGAPALVCCTQLSHVRGDAARRREQLEVILQHPGWREPAAMRVLGGDFNADAASPEVGWLAGHATLEVRSVLAPGAAGPTHPLPPRPDRAGRRIDFLFIVGSRGEAAPCVRHAAIALDAPRDGVWPSDHAAVVSDCVPVGSPLAGYGQCGTGILPVIPRTTGETPVPLQTNRPHPPSASYGATRAGFLQKNTMTTKILCVHSFTAHGVVGLKPFITVLGEWLVAVPSLLLTGPGNMPGCRRFDADLAGLLEGALAALAARGETAWVFVGYLADDTQVDIVEEALERHAGAVAGLVVDPICGDHGRAYVAPALIAAWPRLLARADWALPNFTELDLLTGRCGEEAVATLRARHPRLGLVVTSWPADGGVGTRLYGADGGKAEQVQPREAGGGSGTGDLFAAVWLREVLLLGARPEIAVGTAAAAVVNALQMGVARGSGELALGNLV